MWMAGSGCVEKEKGERFLLRGRERGSGRALACGFANPGLEILFATSIEVRNRFLHFVVGIIILIYTFTTCSRRVTHLPVDFCLVLLLFLKSQLAQVVKKT